MEKEFDTIPREKFRFVHGRRSSAEPVEQGPVTGYFRDAWKRFRRGKAAVVAAIIILVIVCYACLAPLMITTHDATFMVSYYARKPARITALRKWGIFDGGVNRQLTEAALIMPLAPSTETLP